MAFRIVDSQTSVGVGRGTVCVGAETREEFQSLGIKAAQKFAEQYMAKESTSSARVSSVSAPYPAAEGATDDELGNGLKQVEEWRVDVRFLSMP